MSRLPLPLDVDQLVELYAAGMSVDQIAASVGIRSGGSVASRLHAAGVQLRPGTPPEIPVDDQLILRLWAKGLSGREIGERVGMNTATVHSRIRRNRLTGRLHGQPRTKLDVAKMVRLYESGLSLDEVGEQMGVTGSTVAKRLRAAGVERRRGGLAHPATDAEILRLQAEGLTGPQIGARVGLSKDGVYTRLRKVRLAAARDARSVN